MSTNLRVTYSGRARCVYIYLVGHIPPGGVSRTIKASDDINLDLDQHGRLVGIELLSGDTLHPTLAIQAERIDR